MRPCTSPAWTPPDEVFAPVWAALYVMIALAGWIVWRAQGLGPALWLWLVQLVLNARLVVAHVRAQADRLGAHRHRRAVARDPRVHRRRLAGAPLRLTAVRSVFPVGELRRARSISRSGA